VTPVIAPIPEGEVESGYAVLRTVAAWLDSIGRRQRIARTTFETYRRWQAAKGNHAVRVGDSIACVFTVVREPLADWPDAGITGDVWWLRALATHPEHRGRGHGAAAVVAARELVPDHEALYLDCVSDFLPEYYAALGFEHVARQVRTFPEDGDLDITLMRQGQPTGDTT
jgi:GNAT superfamily N-acetyltransferase